MELESEVIFQVYELIDMIKNSNEVKDYLQYKKQVEEDHIVIQLKRKLEKEKIGFEEVQRFGIFHPNYHEQKKNMDQIITQIDENDHIQQLKSSEKKLNELLYIIANTLAKSVSDTVMVIMDDQELQGCAIGGACQTCGTKDNCSI